MHSVILKNLALFTCLIPVVIILFYILRNSIYLVSEFIFIPNNTEEFEKCNHVNAIERVPHIIHQIHGFKDSNIKINHLDKMQMWKSKHKSYTYNLWNETSVNNLIEREYKYIYPLYKSYGAWIQRADVARYVILHHYGGWYIDLDVRCNKGLHELVEEAYRQKKRVILHTTFPCGTSNDIFGITPRHPYLRSVLDNLQNSNRWYLIPHWNILLSAGSTYMWGRYLNYPCKDDILVLDKDEYREYFQIEHDGSWHSWDDGVAHVFIIIINNRTLLTTSLMLFSFILLICLRNVGCKRVIIQSINSKTSSKHEKKSRTTIADSV